MGEYSEGIHVDLQSRGLCSIFKHGGGGELDLNREEWVTSSIPESSGEPGNSCLKICHFVFQGLTSSQSESWPSQSRPATAENSAFSGPLLLV